MSLDLIFLFIQNINHGPKRDLIHRSREKSFIRPLLYHQATTEKYLNLRFFVGRIKPRSQPVFFVSLVYCFSFLFPLSICAWLWFSSVTLNCSFMSLSLSLLLYLCASLYVSVCLFIKINNRPNQFCLKSNINYLDQSWIWDRFKY